MADFREKRVMTVQATERPSERPSEQRVAKMLGVVRLFKGNAGSAVAVHEALHAGLPRRALLRAIPDGMPVPSLLPVFGISLRTFMRLKNDPDKLLDAEQSGRVWQFAELFANAEEVLGSHQRAVDWMMTPAMALENRRPIDLLTTPVGAQLVDDVIERMRYGVYQ
jgi:putative toxin-antitoxin system antitoxin component (TIGR02293 family)